MPGGDREGARIVAQPALERSDEVGQREIRAPVLVIGLLPEHAEARDLLVPLFAAKKTMSSPSEAAGQSP